LARVIDELAERVEILRTLKCTMACDELEQFYCTNLQGKGESSCAALTQLVTESRQRGILSSVLHRLGYPDDTMPGSMGVCDLNPVEDFVKQPKGAGGGAGNIEKGILGCFSALTGDIDNLQIELTDELVHARPSSQVVPLCDLEDMDMDPFRVPAAAACEDMDDDSPEADGICKERECMPLFKFTPDHGDDFVPYDVSTDYDELEPNFMDIRLQNIFSFQRVSSRERECTRIRFRV